MSEWKLNKCWKFSDILKVYRWLMLSIFAPKSFVNSIQNWWRWCLYEDIVLSSIFFIRSTRFKYNFIVLLYHWWITCSYFTTTIFTKIFSTEPVGSCRRCHNCIIIMLWVDMDRFPDTQTHTFEGISKMQNMKWNASFLCPHNFKRWSSTLKTVWWLTFRVFYREDFTALLR